MNVPDQRLRQRDLRATASFQAASDLFGAITRPGKQQVCDATEIHASPLGDAAVFGGYIANDLASATRTRICNIDLASGEMRVLTSGPHTDRQPKFSRDGQLVAFLSDREKAGDFQLFLLDTSNGVVRSTPRVDGWVEYLHWSPDGRNILLGVADHGADVAAAHGAVASKAADDGLPSWLPTMETGDDAARGRRAWIYCLASDCARLVGAPDRNVWEAVWCGDGGLVAIVSPGSGEGLWYSARLAQTSLDADGWRDIYNPADQLGWPAASPTGRQVAVVEAVCSDRWIVAGDVYLIEMSSGKIRRLYLGDVDVTHTEWRSETKLLVAGHRGYDTVVGLYDTGSDAFIEIWASREISMAGRYATVSGIGDTGDCLLIGEGFRRSPEIATIRDREYRSVKSFDLGYAAQAAAISAVECVNWKAADGLDIQGWLLRPRGAGPFPLVMNIHGGPVLLWHPMWLGRHRYVPLFLLIQRGYAIFLPNPRGSSGRGREFARRVVGAMGGADADDLLAGIDHLVHVGVADANRLGVTGVSYGGFMTCRLITQDQRFAAAVPIAPITYFVTEQLTSNIPHFVKMFLDDEIGNSAGNHFRYSPLLHADRVATPTLNICGALDRCTPPQEAIQFHNALVEHDVTSALACYPEEGHGIHGFPAAIDLAARIVDWFEHFMPAAQARYATGQGS